MRERWIDARIWLLRKTPAGLLWHPFEWFVAILCILSGVAQLAGYAEPQSVERLLPGPFLKLWGIFLVLGSVALASGLSSIEATSADRYVVTRVPSYRLGLRLLAIAVTVYVVALLLYAGPAAIPACVIPAAFVLMCGVRLLALGGRR